MRLKAMIVSLVVSGSYVNTDVAIASDRGHDHAERDPYAYQYSQRGYYPYNNSTYWRSAAELRARGYAHYNDWNTRPPRYRYYQYWGYPNKKHHSSSHDEHNGGRHRWQW